jgi:hypothetical protein
MFMAWARCLHTADDPAAEEHVATWALGLLAGHLEEVMDDLTAQAALLPADQRDGLEAAARHLVCDRLDITGARWGRPEPKPS